MVEGHWFRFDRHHPEQWDWTPFRRPRHRFDSFSGCWRVRYAGRTFRGAARERWDATGRVVSEAEGEQWMALMVGRLQVLDLRSEHVLDALAVDDRLNTGRLALDRRDGDATLDTCGALTDRARAWFGEDLHGFVYRSRTTSETSMNLAFWRDAPMAIEEAVRLDTLDERWDELVLASGFHIDAPWGP